MIFLLQSFVMVFSAECSSISSVSVRSGNFNLGEFSLGDTLYILPNLKKDPLSIDYIVKGSCSDSVDVQGKLFASSPYDSADTVSYDSEKNETHFRFIYTAEITLTGYITPYVNGFGRENLAFTAYVDDKAPMFSNIVFRKNNQEITPPILTRSNDNVTVSFSASDNAGSGIKSVVVDGTSFEINQTPGDSIPISKTINLSTSVSRDIIITAIDNLGNSETKVYPLNIDNTAPSYVVRNVEISQNSGRKLTIPIEITDNSFSNEKAPNVRLEVLDPTLISSNPERVICTYKSGYTWVCYFKNFDVYAIETSDVPLKILVSDDAGNQRYEEFSVNVFIDSSGPEITSFEFTNSFGGLNVFSPIVEGGGILKVEYSDESELLNYITDFDLITEPLPQEFDCGEFSFCWNFTYENLNIFTRDLRPSIPFTIILMDAFSNSNQKTVNITIDKNEPRNVSYQLFEKNVNVEDGLFGTGDLMTVKINVTEEHFDLEHIVGNFSLVAVGSQVDALIPSCSQISPLTYTCVFDDVRLGTGYKKENATIHIYDDAGNEFTLNIPIEILEKNGSTSIPQPFYVTDLKTSQRNSLHSLMPINRHAASKGSLVWFQGKLKTQDSRYEVINYQIGDCEDINISVDGFDDASDILPVYGFSLYPTQVITRFSEGAVDGKPPEKFTLNYQLDPIETPIDTLETQCSLIVLFRDNTTIYNAGQHINITTTMDFYGLLGTDEDPNIALLRRYAKDFRKDLDRIEKYGGDFAKAYEITNRITELCNAVNTFDSIWNQGQILWSFVSLGLKYFPWTYSSAKAIDNIKSPPSGILSEAINGYGGAFDKLCGFVSCQYGTLFSEDGKESGDTGFFADFFELINSADEICGLGEVGSGGN
jgi:hypothetical protein